jgi:hypothetical protein
MLANPALAAAASRNVLRECVFIISHPFSHQVAVAVPLENSIIQKVNAHHI